MKLTLKTNLSIPHFRFPKLLIQNFVNFQSFHEILFHHNDVWGKGLLRENRFSSVHRTGPKRTNPIFPNTRHLPFDPQKIILDRSSRRASSTKGTRWKSSWRRRRKGMPRSWRTRFWNFKRRHKPESTTHSRQNKEIQFRAQREGEKRRS